MVHDAIVLGLGGMGSAALWHLARRGLRVLGIEQFGLAHDRGSSHGQSRLIRRAYFEHPDYVPLVDRAYQLWSELENACGQRLFHRTGLYLAGQGNGPLVEGVLRAAATHRLAIETISQANAAARFRGLRADPDMTILFESDAGFLDVEKCVQAHVEQAEGLGAKTQFQVRVLRWSIDGEGVRVETDRGTHWASRLVLCGGPWSASLLGSLRLPLQIRRKVVAWYPTVDGSFRVGNGSPVFCIETPAGFFYGFPSFDGRTIKVGEHSGGQPVTCPEALDRGIHEADTGPLQNFLARHVPAASPRMIRHSVCMYTMTPDENFIIDRHPNYDNVLLACGFSGHGFKFASVIGSILADFVTRGGTDEPGHFLRLERLLRRPG